MSPAIPGTRGLFSVLQDALGRGDRRRVRINRHVHATATTFRALLGSLAHRSTRLQELTPSAPIAIGASDACRLGMGGVWLFPDPNIAPIVWRQSSPNHIVKKLITADHRGGTVSISDLELAGIIAHKDAVAHAREHTLWIASDNRAAVLWSTKGSSTSNTARAYLLQEFNALHQRQHRFVARHHYIPGAVNAMADDASRLWHLTDAQLLSHFRHTYPQATSWRMLPLTSATNSALIGALLRKPPPTVSLANVTPTPVPRGVTGKHSVLPWTSIPPHPRGATPSLFSSSLHNVIVPARSLPVVSLSALGQWRMPYEQLVRRSPGWGPRTLD